MLMNGARVDGGGGDDAADDAGLMEGEVLPAVLAALKAGCGIEGPVMGALRNSAGVAGDALQRPPVLVVILDDATVKKARRCLMNLSSPPSSGRRDT